MRYLFAFCETKKNPINPAGLILQIVIIVYINHTQMLSGSKREKERKRNTSSLQFSIKFEPTNESFLIA